MISQQQINAFLTEVHQANTGRTGWTRSRSSLRFTLTAIEDYNRNLSLQSFNTIRQCIGQIPAAKTMQYANALQRLGGYLDAEEDAVQQREETRRLKDNAFRVNSDRAGYEKSFGASYTELLRSLTKRDRWLDGGAGEANAMIKYLDGGGAARCTAVGYEIPKTAAVSVEAAINQFKGRFEYLHGKFFSEFSDQELDLTSGGFDLITDLNGVLYYTQTLEEDLTRYLELLNVGGLLAFTGISVEIKMPNVDDHDSRRVPDFARWASNIHGVSLIWDASTGAYLMRKEADDIKVPNLTRNTFKLRDGRNDPLREYSCSLNLPNQVRLDRSKI